MGPEVFGTQSDEDLAVGELRFATRFAESGDNYAAEFSARRVDADVARVRKEEPPEQIILLLWRKLRQTPK